MDFKAALKRELSSIKKKYKLKEDKAFTLWFAVNVLDIDDAAGFEAVSVEGANDKGIDLFYVDDNAGRVIIAQTKYSPKLTYTPKESNISVLESSTNWLASPEALEKEGRPELTEAAREYVEAIKKDYGTELVYVYTGKKTTNIDKKVAVYNQNPEQISRNRAMRHYHLELLEDLWNEIHGGRQRIREDTVRITDGYETEGEFGEAVVASVPCSELVRLYNAHGDRLFVRNVRLYLGARKGSVNAEIAATIKSSTDRGNFWAYNNGITVICDDYERSGTSVKLTNFSIVNGAQTTVSLAENEGVHRDLVVLVRFIAASEDIVDNVIRSTNSQNPIRPWDIASQFKTQRRLKHDFEKLKKPWLYVTRRGDRPTSGLSKYRDGRKSRQIRFDLAGQYLTAFKAMPVVAYKQKALIFFRYHDAAFPGDVKAEEVLFVWECAEACKAAVLELMTENEGNERVLKKGGTLFSLAVMGEVLKTRNGATYLAKLEEDRIASTKTRKNLTKIAKYATLAYLAAVQDEMESQSTELATLLRQTEFFDRVMKRVRRQYERDALNREWLDGAVPKLW